MATIEDTHAPAQNQPGLTRREAFSGAIQASSVLALPAVVLAEHALVEGAVPSDPHVEWWREMVEVNAQLDGERMADDKLLDRNRELEDLISQTPPTTPEGTAIVATMIVAGHRRMYPDGSAGLIEPEDTAGETLARRVLAQTPADVLRRAGLEVQP